MLHETKEANDDDDNKEGRDIRILHIPYALNPQQLAKRSCIERKSYYPNAHQIST